MNIKKSLVAASLFGLAMSANAEIKISFDKAFAISAGETKTLDVNLAVTSPSTDKVASFQFDVVLPEGLSVAYTTSKGKKVYTVAYSSDFNDSDYGDSWKFSVTEANKNRFLYSNGSNDPLYVEEMTADAPVTLVSLTLVADASYKGGVIRLENVTGGFPGEKPEINGYYELGELAAGVYSSFSVVGYQTYGESIPYDGIAFEGATAYYAQYNGDDNVIDLVEVTGNMVPASTGVVLKGTGTTVVCKTVAKVDPSTIPSTYALKPSDPSLTITGDYVLSTVGGVTAFYKYTGANMEAGKAYLPASVVSGSPARVIFADDATGLEGLEAAQGAKTVFNLQGQMVKGAASGISVVNGKKVMY